MRILFTAGGTAGHINPAIGVAEALLKEKTKHDILFVGRSGGAENRLIKNAGFELKTIKICGIERKVSIKNIKNIFIALSSVKAAKRIIKDFKPDIIFGTGGYASFPSLRAGISLKIPTVIHESNITPGFVTKLLHQKCELVFINLDGTRKYLSEKANVLTVGNPLREDFAKFDRKSARRSLGLSENDFFILSFGGSGGAEKINTAAISLMKNHSSKSKHIKHTHATGISYYEKAKKNESELCGGHSGCKIVPYINDMPKLLHAADVVISRCGALTISELCAVGTAAILIPSPNVTNNHQYKNAAYLKERDAAIMLEESELSCERLCELLVSLQKDKEARIKLGRNIRMLKKESPEKIIINELSKIAKS